MKKFLLAILVIVILSSQAFSKTSTLEKAFPYLAKKLVSKKTKPGQTVAMLPLFTLDGETSKFGKYFAEQLLTELYSAGNFKIVDRTLMDKVLTEMKLTESGAFDPGTIKKLGKMLGADIIGTGTYTYLGKKIQINSRLINTETGVVMGAGRMQIKADDTVRFLLGQSQNTSKTSAAPSTTKKGSLIWEDSKCKEHLNRKVLANFKDALLRYCENKDYYFKTTDKAKGWYWSYYSYTAQDFILEATVEKISGSENSYYGLAFHIDDASKPNRYYWATITGKGEYKLGKYTGKDITLRQGKSEHINQGNKSNHLQVICIGDQIQFFVNGKLVASATDSLLKDGKIGHLVQAGGHFVYRKNLKAYAIK